MVASGGGACVIAPGGMRGCSREACMLAPRGACMLAPRGHACLLSGWACMLAPGGHACLLPGGVCSCTQGVCVVAPGGDV